MRMQDITWAKYLGALVVICGVDLASGAAVSVTNPSFEADAVATAGGFTPTITGWTGAGDINTFGTFRPSAASYPLGAPNGLNVAYVGADGNPTSIKQTLGATVQPLTSYTLSFRAGQRLDDGFYGYSAEIDAGAVQLAALTGQNAAVGPQGTFIPLTLNFVTGVTPAQLGSPITIKFTYAGSGSAAEPGQLNLDQIAFDASTVPEPSFIGVLSFGAIALRRRRATALALWRWIAVRPRIGTGHQIVSCEFVAGLERLTFDSQHRKVIARRARAPTDNLLRKH